MLDVGLSDEQRTELYAQINRLLARTAGIQVDFAQLHQLQIALDCSVGLDVDYGDIITDFNAREVLLSTLDSLADDGDPDTVSQGEAAMDSVDRVFGYYDAQMDAVDAIAQGFTDHPFAPIDVNRFAPMYNTIALNKLILLGSGNDRCATLEQECQGDNPPPGCGECGGGDSDDIVITATKEFPNAGIMDLVQKANLVEFGEAYQHAYSTDQLDEDPDTYLQSFFQEQFVEQGSWHGCEDTGFNIACGAFYSIDDPKDYCEALGSWDPEYLTDKLWGERVLTVDPEDSTIQLHMDAAYENGVIRRNGIPLLMDCAFALYRIDTAYREDRSEYAPNPRHRIGPSDDPHITAYTTPIAADDYLGVDNHRSTTLDRVIKQRAPSYSNWRDWVRDLVHTADTLMFTDGTTTGEPPAPQPAPTEELETYYPHNLTRFSIVNKDTHVTRLYSRIFAPFYCAEVDGTTQYDSDCDSIPNACDNCPLTYNPDQLDSNRDSIGDDCFGFDPYSVPITPTPTDKIDIQCSATNPLDLYREIEQNVATMR